MTLGTPGTASIEVTLRHDSRLRHTEVGRRHARTRVLMLVAGLNVRIVSEGGDSYATLALAAGALLDVVSRQLGHASLTITADVYGHDYG